MTAVVASTAHVQGTGRRLVALDGYRAIAALAVLATHVGFMTAASVDGRFATVLSRLDIGVAVFFALSGFLLFTPYVARWLAEQPAPSVGAYFWHRALRVLPLYWVAVAAAAMLVTRDGPWSGRQWLSQLLLLQAWSPGTQALGLTQMWSLSTEVAFYVLLPLLALLLLRRGRSPATVAALLVAVAAASIGYRVVIAWSSALPETASLQLPAHLDWFAAGMLLALLRQCAQAGVRLPVLDSARVVANMPGWCVTAALGTFALATTPVAGPRQLTPPTGFENLAKHLLYLATAALLLLPVVLGESSWLSRGLSHRALVWVGGVSYGIFCLHLVVLEALYGWTGLELFSGWLWLVLPVAVGASLAVAGAAHALVERPVSRWRDLVPSR